ncbi:MAG: DNA translocase FtsK 4TM domain-containing protein, partial [Planctomycetes bacterium]|nr:DNA translocase FtsK 4TM domain-containing protein [Planctomycetota bacterium]
MSRAETETPSQTARVFGPIFLLAVCFFCWGALLSFDVGDWPSPHQTPHNDPAANACGRAGAFIAYGLLYYLGDGAYLLALFATLAAGTWLVHGRLTNPLQRLAGLTLLISCTAAGVHLVSGPGSGPLPEGPGGILGNALGGFVSDNFSSLGAVVVLGYAVLIGLLFTAEGWMMRLPGLLSRVGRVSGGALAIARSAVTTSRGLEPARRDGGGDGRQRDDRAESIAVAPKKRPDPKINANRPKSALDVEPDEATLFDDPAPPTRRP